MLASPTLARDGAPTISYLASPDRWIWVHEQCVSAPGPCEEEAEAQQPVGLAVEELACVGGRRLGSEQDSSPRDREPADVPGWSGGWPGKTVKSKGQAVGIGPAEWRQWRNGLKWLNGLRCTQDWEGCGPSCRVLGAGCWHGGHGLVVGLTSGVVLDQLHWTLWRGHGLIAPGAARTKYRHRMAGRGVKLSNNCCLPEWCCVIQGLLLFLRAIRGADTVWHLAGCEMERHRQMAASQRNTMEQYTTPGPLPQCQTRFEGPNDVLSMAVFAEEPLWVEVLAAIQCSWVALEWKIEKVAVEVNLLRVDLIKWEYHGTMHHAGASPTVPDSI
ncbi:hypothetical protein NDU88_003624 [Pleurodeles waltl]|uniref:Uncharacterized protein n=1 Tax=Pleurodeles waltl TaxID=8319 RepID=A0AAV7NRD5_PLEWA|nr:hypothetical protein NDU88_003624 [Pleurodeles waltl]